MSFSLSEQNFIYITCTLVLVLKVFVTNMLLGMVRIKNNLRTPEDYSSFPFLQNMVSKSGHNNIKELKIQRWNRIVQNDQENIPYSLILFWAGYLIDNTNMGMAISFMIFTFCRLLYSVFFAYEKQPFRSIVFGIGWLSVLYGGISAFVKSVEEL